MHDNSLLKGNSKKLEFGGITPLKPFNLHSNDFYSMQKMKYDQDNKQKQTQFNFSSEQGKEIYENQIPIKIKSKDREEINTYLSIRIYMINSNQNRSNTIRVELTDDTNNLFLYTLDINDQDFMILKQEQQLLVDFHSFPNRLVEIVELSLNENSITQKEEKVNFSCVFEIKNQNEGHFSIMEINQFKMLSHLCLKFRAATDDKLKSYLSQKYSKERQDNEELRIKNQRLEESLQIHLKELDNQTLVIQQLNKDKDKTVSRIQMEEQRKLNEAVEKALNKETNFLKEQELEKRKIQEQYESQIHSISSKNEELLNQNQSLIEKKLELESSNRDLSNSVHLNQKELEFLKQELENFRNEARTLDKQNFTQEKNITELRVRNEALHKQLVDKEELIQQNKQLNENQNKQKVNLEQNLQQEKKNNEKLEIQIIQLQEDINKANMILEKMQNEIEKKKSKIKMKNQLILHQEQINTQIQEALDKSTKQHLQDKNDIDNKTFKIQNLENQVKDLKEKLNEAQKLIEQNNEMIQYLNKQLNDSHKPFQNTINKPSYQLHSRQYNQFNNTLLNQNNYAFKEKENNNLNTINLNYLDSKHSRFTTSSDFHQKNNQFSSSFLKSNHNNNNNNNNFNKSESFVNEYHHFNSNFQNQNLNKSFLNNEKENLDFSNNNIKETKGSIENQDINSLEEIKPNSLGIQPIRYKNPQNLNY